MILAIMAYAALVAAAVALAARVAEWGMERWGWAVRWVWLGAAVLSVAVPALRVFGERGASEDGSDGAIAREIIRLPAILVPSIPESALFGLGTMDVLLLGGWALATVALVVRWASRRRRLQIARDSWERRRLDGTPVLVAPNVGPAVVGGLGGEVVVPTWMLALDADARALVLGHELEHLRAGDAILHGVGRFLVIALPWNPALWFIERRLRGAIEVDCDRRVLRRTRGDRRAYGALLLHVAGQGAPADAIVPALSESYSLLARRINAMTHPPRMSPLVLMACLTVAGTMVVAACNTEVPQVAQSAVAADASSASPTVEAPPLESQTANSREPDQPYFDFQVEIPVRAEGATAPRYPDILRKAGVEGEVLVQFVVDTMGNVEPATFKTLKATHELFASAVREALPGMTFTPARLKGAKVRQLVQQPFSFAMAR